MDNHHVNISDSSISCGVAELSRIESDSHKVLYAMASRLYHPSRGQPYTFFIWSDVEDSNGERLCQFIGDLKFNWPNRSSKVENPKTGNEIRLYYWEIPHEVFRKWYVEQRIQKAKTL